MTPTGPAGLPLTLAAFDPGADGDQILGILAWSASACGVAGLITIGIQMALQLRRGDPGEGGEHFRGVFFVLLGCVIAASAGPLVAALGDLSI
ncbi:hypothetical protein ACGF5O_20200 [Streptomyces sp. NPDC048291]|uniref:hypothetical protein n=1 Tax=Streptomyces sp. NPDC048291 TaxID=3365530 RepID=UPI0037191D0B